MFRMSVGRLPALVYLQSAGMLDIFRASSFSMAYNLLNAGKKACNCFAISSVCEME